jgi:hypothetical protein
VSVAGRRPVDGATVSYSFTGSGGGDTSRMDRATVSRRTALATLGSAALTGGVVTLGSTEASAGERVELRVSGSGPEVRYRVEYDTGRVETGTAEGRDDDVYGVRPAAAVRRLTVENTADRGGTVAFEHATPRHLSPRLDGDVTLRSPTDTETRYSLHTPVGGRTRVYGSDTELFQDERERSDRYAAGEAAVGVVVDGEDRWDFEGQFRFVVLDLDANAEFELTRDLL